MIPHEERVRYISRSDLMAVEGCEKCWVADKIITGPSRLRRFFQSLYEHDCGSESTEC